MKAQKNDNLKNHKNVLNDFKIRKKTFQNEKKGRNAAERKCRKIAAHEQEKELLDPNHEKYI